MIDGLILAGGESLRMGCDKAGLRVGGKTLLQHQIDQMYTEVGQLFVAKNATLNEATINNVVFVEDFYTGRAGPLSGALAALNASSAEFLWVMPCDSYGFDGLLRQQLLRALADTGADIAYIKHQGNRHPLLAVWRTSIKEALSVYLQAGGRSVLKWYASMPAVAVDCIVEKGQCCNMNTPEDFQALLDTLC